ncbi:MAG: succinyldiaminopimelate transaminase [Oceanospirillaceae bacterium]|nr:succinyldiaminopimelate transaminase [Oceanospirillaceae bacterium]
MNPALNQLQPYPFERLTTLMASVTPANVPHIAFSIGEPKHASPAFVIKALTDNIDGLAKYPSTKGIPELSECIAKWCERRFSLVENSLDAKTAVIPVNGTREAIFAFIQAAVTRSDDALVLCPNPFYQIYEGAAYLSGAQPYYLNCHSDNHFIPDYDVISADIWQRCQVLFICSPGNPTGSVTDLATLQKLIALADEYDFIIVSDECYSEIYFDEKQPPVGLLEACALLGRNDYHRCVVMHSLSKRSNLPGMRSGFVAGDSKLLVPFLHYRTYHGSAMPIQHQHASLAAWSDEAHVLENRDAYRAKFAAVIDILAPVLDVSLPDASFYLWVKTPIDDEIFARDLFAQQNLTLLPGSYVSREIDGVIPGKNYVRMALVATLDECIEGAQRIRTYIESLNIKDSP